MKENTWLTNDSSEDEKIANFKNLQLYDSGQVNDEDSIGSFDTNLPQGQLGSASNIDQVIRSISRMKAPFDSTKASALPVPQTPTEGSKDEASSTITENNFNQDNFMSTNSERKELLVHIAFETISSDNSITHNEESAQKSDASKAKKDFAAHATEASFDDSKDDIIHGKLQEPNEKGIQAVKPNLTSFDLQENQSNWAQVRVNQQNKPLMRLNTQGSKTQYLETMQRCRNLSKENWTMIPTWIGIKYRKILTLN